MKFFRNFCVINFIFLFGIPSQLLAEGYGSTDYWGSGNAVLRAMAQKKSNDTNFVAVGRMWDAASYYYKGLIASYSVANGGQDLSFGLAGNPLTPNGKMLFDFAEGGLESLCSAVTYGWDGFIAACRSMKSTGYWDVYLVKFDNQGNLNTIFGTNGIQATGIGGNSTNGHAFVRGIVYNKMAQWESGGGGLVTIVGGVGSYTGNFHPYIATFKQGLGTQVGTTVQLTGLNGTAVGVVFDNGTGGGSGSSSGGSHYGGAGYYYMASTETNSSANRHFYVDRFDQDLTASASPWGSALDFTAPNGADSVPSAITILNGDLIIVGGNRTSYSGTPWRCAVAAVKMGSGNLDTAFGTASTISGGADNVGVSLFSHDGSTPSKDCILNNVALPIMGNHLLVAGTAYNGTNYDYLSAELNSTGTLVSQFGTSGITVQTGNSSDDVLNGILHFSNVNKTYAVGRSLNTSGFNGIVTSEITTAMSTSGDSWTATTSTNAPSARSINSFSGVWTGSKMLLFGGLSGMDALNSGALYDPTTNSWSTTTSTNAPTTRAWHSSVWTGSKLIVWGGSIGFNGGNLNSGGSYDPVTDSWSATTTTNSAGAISYQTTVFTGSKMVVWGGASAAGGSTWVNTGGVYDVTANSWTVTTTNSPPESRKDHTAVWAGSQMIVWGGFGSIYLNTGGLYNPVTNTWSATPLAGSPSIRQLSVAVWTGSNMVVWGGYNNGTYYNTGWRFDPVAYSWSAITTTNSPTARWGSTSLWSGSKMIVWGGDTGSTTNTGGIYDPITDSWSATVATNAASATNTVPSIWTGSKMLVFNGANNTGGVYTPVSGTTNSGVFTSTTPDSWSATTTTNALPVNHGVSGVWTGTKMFFSDGVNGGSIGAAGSYDAVTNSWSSISDAGNNYRDRAVVWTGSKMILWGGGNGPGAPTLVNSGRIYDPSTDTWSATTTTNAPTARSYITGVWTGTKMVVWSGSTDRFPTTMINSGGIYNLTTNAWSATTSTNAPVGVASYTGVWTGSKMIVWGGTTNGASTSNAGALYNLTTDAWSATTSTSAPVTRNMHSAVWTGNKMILWGGNTGATYYNSGGIYDPSTDSWTATTTTNSPKMRTQQSLLWTGNKALVWGGYDGSTYYNSGGLYDPVSNSWAATSATNAPPGASQHLSVWTGSKMVVWGGTSGSSLNTGGVYTPP